MKRMAIVGAFLFSGILGWMKSAAIHAEDVPSKYQTVVERGLAWLVKQQDAHEGYWTSNGDQYRSTMTALAGVALLMEGSTLREGKHREPIRRAVDYLITHTQANGLIGDPSNVKNTTFGYMYGHGFSVLFLSQLFGEEEDLDLRRKLEGILTRAVDFTGKAQTSRGGWGYTSAKDMLTPAYGKGTEFDEGSTTITQVQALRAARNAGIKVPKEIIDNMHKYLRDCTTARGGLIYSLSNRNIFPGERPTITAAGVASMFSSGEYNSPLAKRWLKYVQPLIPLDRAGGETMGHSEYTHLYYGQVAYTLGEDGYAKLFPGSRTEERLTWSKYRRAFFPYVARTQRDDGSWIGCGIGPVFTTAIYLIILQLDKATLPIYQR